MAKLKNLAAVPGDFGTAELPAAPTLTTVTTIPGRYRVQMEGVRPLVVDPIREVPAAQDYLDVEAASEWEAVEAFAHHNGIPIVTDELTGQRRPKSIHAPQVELLRAQ